MITSSLYKYLDVDGGIKMLSDSNLQFTNATQLNDPFDCHPGLIDFSNVPEGQNRIWGKDAIVALKSNTFERRRNNTWICSLSKNYNSILMWSYYNNHRGVCIGLNIEKTREYLSKVHCRILMGAIEMEVQYRDIIDKPDYYHSGKDLFRYQLSTKAKEWEHEQEVRLILEDPSYVFVPAALIRKPRSNDVVDWKEVRFYPHIGNECFDSLYLGINIPKDKRAQIIQIATDRNPDINIIQMTVDPGAFRLKERRINDL